MSEIDWQSIREDYERGSSLRVLASKYGIGKSVIGERKFKEQWDKTKRTAERTYADSQRVPTTPPNRDINAAARVAQAIPLRQAGWTYGRIAVQCGYSSESSCRKAIQREMDRVITQNIDAWRNDHMSRLEKLHEEAWTLAMDRTNTWRLSAYDRLLVIEERQAKLLGLDARADEQSLMQAYKKEIILTHLKPEVQP